MGRHTLNLVRALGAASIAALIAVGTGCTTAESASGTDSQSTKQGGQAAPVVSPDGHVITLDGPRELVTRDGAYRVTWSPDANEIPINEHFDARVRVERNDAQRTPVTGADVSLTCFMPDHGHGMLREPQTQELGGGEYLVRPLLLHMDGFWTVSISVVVDGLAAAADDELHL